MGKWTNRLVIAGIIVGGFWAAGLAEGTKYPSSGWLAIAGIICGIIWWSSRSRISDLSRKVSESKAELDEFRSQIDVQEEKSEKTTAHLEYYREEYSNHTAKLNGFKFRRNRAIGVITAVAVVIALGQHWKDTRDQEQRWDAFLAGYDEGWEEACDYLFYMYSPSGKMYYGNMEFTDGWCRSLRSSNPPDSNDFEMSALLDNTKQARRSGQSSGGWEARKAISEYTDYLCYGSWCRDIPFLDDELHVSEVG